MHRLGNGDKIINLSRARRQWRAQGRSPSTYCNKREWDRFKEDLGELVERFPDGTEVRRHATVKTDTRGGSYKIAHNRVIVGNPGAYARWQADPRPVAEKGWMPDWTYYPDGLLERVLATQRSRFVTTAGAE